MNTLELAVYNLVKRNPRLKLGIRNVYQRVCDVVPVKSIDSPYEVIAREGFYFGFHDKSPWSPDETNLLANRVLVPLRMPLPEDELEIGYFRGPNHLEFVPVAKTRAWNWQQGCMLQWVGNTGYFLFNDFDGSRHVARIYSTHNAELQRIAYPIGAVSPDGNWGLTYSFERCRIYSPGYGYANGTDPELHVERPKTHGMQIVNLASGTARTMFSVADIANLKPDATMDGAFHYLTHCQFSPSSQRFVFFHRWIKNFNYLRTRMISSDLDGTNLHVFPTDGMVSHVAWRDVHHVLAYARVKEKGDRYVLFQDLTENHQVIGENKFNSDGHPSFSPDKQWIVTDTYPDRFRTMFLSLYNAKNDRRVDLAKIKSPKPFASPRFETNWHCDLHPRWNRSGEIICFDSAHTGRRALCTLNAASLLTLDEKAH